MYIKTWFATQLCYQVLLVGLEVQDQIYQLSFYNDLQKLSRKAKVLPRDWTSQVGKPRNRLVRRPLGEDTPVLEIQVFGFDNMAAGPRPLFVLRTRLANFEACSHHHQLPGTHVLRFLEIWQARGQGACTIAQIHVLIFI